MSKKMTEKNEENIEVRDVVQLSPETRFPFGFMVVEELKPWGAKGYLQVFEKADEYPDRIYLREKWDRMKKIGRAEWALASPEEE